MDKRIKSAPDSVAAIDGGTVKGYASTFVRTPDSYGDVIAEGAFAESLERWKALNEQGKYIPLLYGHNMDDPAYNIGRVTLAKEDGYGLYVEAEFDPDNEKAQYVRKLVQEGRLYQFSFAFRVLDECETELDDGTKANELRKVDIYEVSLVQIPANQTAVVTEVKSSDVAVPSTHDVISAVAEAVQDATGFAVQDIEVSASCDSLPEVSIRAIAYDGLKVGRRNSAKDAGELERIGALASEIKETVNGLLDRADDEAEAEGKSCDKAAAEDRGDEDRFVDAYREAVKTLLKGRL